MYGTIPVKQKARAIPSSNIQGGDYRVLDWYEERKNMLLLQTQARRYSLSTTKKEVI